VNRTDILAALREEIARLAPEVEFDGLDPAVDLREQADLDSMDFLNLQIGLHQRLGLTIAQRDVVRLTTIDGAVACLLEAEPAKPETRRPPGPESFARPGRGLGLVMGRQPER
jgi:acyl carrier protein